MLAYVLSDFQTRAKLIDLPVPEPGHGEVLIRIGGAGACHSDLHIMHEWNPENFPPEMGYASPSHMGKPGEIWGVVRELENRYGWDEREIRGFLGENLLRLYKANWQPSG